MRYARVDVAAGTASVSIIERDGDVGYSPVVAVSPTGVLTAFYHHGALGLRVATLGPTGWSVAGLPAGLTPINTTARGAAFADDGTLYVAIGQRTISGPVAVLVRGPTGAWTRRDLTASGRLGVRPLRAAPSGFDLAWNQYLPLGSGARGQWATPAGALDRLVPTAEAAVAIGGTDVVRRVFTQREAALGSGVALWTLSPSTGWSQVSIPTGATASGTTRDGFAITEGPDCAPWATAGHGVFTQPFCTPSCGERRCGDDGCGGSCGACAAGATCMPDGTCDAWRAQALAMPLVGDVIGRLTCAIHRRGRRPSWRTPRR